MSSIPTTGRTPEFLAKQFGYRSVMEMVDKLKSNCVVYDIGAGKSLLGNTITSYRKDIKWINIDPCYKSSKYNNLIDIDNCNLYFLSLDISNKNDLKKIKNKKADYIFTYWLLPHLSTDTDEPAIKIIKSIYELLALDGIMTVGPIKQVGFGFLSPWRYKSSLTYSKSDDLNIITRKLLKATKLWWLPKKLQGFSNKHNIHFAKWFVNKAN